jgi:ketosteroid isomerase-like protein
VENKSEFIENIASGKSDFITMNLSEQVITITNEKVALVRHMLDADILDGGNPNTIKLKVLLVFQKDKAGWILIARQAVKVTP